LTGTSSKTWCAALRGRPTTWTTWWPRSLILAAGAFELGHWPEVPARVVVSQYVDLAHAFLDDRQTALANGVLDTLARHLRPEEFAGEAVPDLTG
jgi:hypothetical protein